MFRIFVLFGGCKIAVHVLLFSQGAELQPFSLRKTAFYSLAVAHLLQTTVALRYENCCNFLFQSSHNFSCTRMKRGKPRDELFQLLAQQSGHLTAVRNLCMKSTVNQYRQLPVRINCEENEL